MNASALDSFEPDSHALTFRAAETRAVMSWIKVGQSGCVIGFKEVGKSTFLRFLLREDIQQHYLGPGWKDFAFVYVDLLALSENSEWAVCELILDRLLSQFRQSKIDPAAAEEIERQYTQVTQNRDKLSVRRAFERGFDALCRQSSRRIVLLFDEFNSIFPTLDPFLFRCMRVVRDDHRGRVSYIAAIPDNLEYLRNDLTQVEHFHRLLGRNVCNLGPYGPADTQQMLAFLARQQATQLSPRAITRLVTLTGGHAGLIKTLLSLMWNESQDNVTRPESESILLDDPTVRAECSKIWEGLSDPERTGLWALANNQSVDLAVSRRLRRKGLVYQDSKHLVIFSPLVAHFVQQQIPSPTNRVVVSRSPRLVQLDGRRIENLSELEFELLSYLYDRRGNACSIDEIITHVYRETYDQKQGDIEDSRVMTMISRLRKKIADPKGRSYVVNVRGKGYRFVEP